MTLNTSQSKDRGIGPTTSLSPTVRANSALDPSEGNLDSIASTSSRPRTRAVRLLPLRLAALAPAPALDAQKAPQQKCLALPRSHFCQMNRFSIPYQGYPHPRDNATGSALTEPAARL
jgi:hypothetical protein